jgi:hypothetical protein
MEDGISKKISIRNTIISKEGKFIRRYTKRIHEKTVFCTEVSSEGEFCDVVQELEKEELWEKIRSKNRIIEELKKKNYRISLDMGRKDTDTVKRALEATRAHKDRWPEPVESPLYMFQQLGYTADHRHVKECIDYFIENQHEDGGWGYYNESPSDPTQTASWTGVLLHYGVKIP